jgi:hypothetical protein
MGNEFLKNGNGIEVMWVDSQFWSVFGVFGHDFCCFKTILFTALPANRHTPAPGILGFLIMRVSECCKCHFRDSNLKIFRAFGTSLPPPNISWSVRHLHTRWLKRS